MKKNNFLYEKHIPELLKKDQTGPAIPLILHMNMLRDKTRLDNFVNLIRKHVRPGMKVLELGTGTGILSLIAAECGGEITTVEAQRTLFDYSKNLFEKKFPGRIKTIRNDARFAELKKEYDFIICEMIDTWLIREVQIQVMNKAIENFLSEGGKILPLSMTNFIEAVEIDNSFYGYEIPLPFYETEDMSKSLSLSEKETVNHINFSEKNEFKFNLAGKILINKKGKVNGLRLSSVIYLDEEIDCGGSDWFAPPLILPLTPEKIDNDTELHYFIDYKAGLGFKSFNYRTELKF